MSIIKQDAHCSAIAETALQGAFWPKVKDWNWETIFYGQNRSIFNHCDIIGLKYIDFGEKKTVRLIIEIHEIHEIHEIQMTKNRNPRNLPYKYEIHQYRNLLNSVKKTQNKGHYGVRGHSRSSRSVPIESPYAMLVINQSINQSIKSFNFSRAKRD